MYKIRLNNERKGDLNKHKYNKALKNNMLNELFKIKRLKSKKQKQFILPIQFEI